MSTGMVVIPRDLIDRIVEDRFANGWFSGLRMSSEQVFLLCGLKANEQTIPSDSVLRLAWHRAAHFRFGRYEERLIEWRTVENVFYKRVASAANMPRVDFESATSLELTPEPRLIILRGEDSTDSTAPIAIQVQHDSEMALIDRLEVKLLDRNPAPYQRAPATLIEAMAGKAVVLVGGGSGGAEVALNLAAIGLGRLTVVDPDTLSTENYFRYISGRSDLGRKKVDVVRSEIQERELPVEVITFGFDVVSSADKLRGLLLQKPDIVICATDSVASRRTVNLNAVLMGIPCIIAGTLNEGRIGEVLTVLPRTTPCYECIRLELGGVLDATESDGRSATPYVGSENDALASSALRSDIALVASLATRAALSVLLPDRFAASPASYMVWGREADRSYGPPFEFDFPMMTNYFSASRRPDCPVCGVVPAELNGLSCEYEAEQILAQIANAAE